MLGSCKRTQRQRHLGFGVWDLHGLGSLLHTFCESIFGFVFVLSFYYPFFIIIILFFFLGGGGGRGRAFLKNP